MAQNPCMRPGLKHAITRGKDSPFSPRDEIVNIDYLSCGRLSYTNWLLRRFSQKTRKCPVGPDLCGWEPDTFQQDKPGPRSAK